MKTHFSGGLGAISLLRDNKNALLLVLFSFYFHWVEQLLLSTSVVTRQYIYKDISLPYGLATFALGVLCLEGWASKYIIQIEYFRFLQHLQKQVTWPAPTQTYFTAFVGLCSLLFRPFFRMTLIVIPVLNPLIVVLQKQTSILWISKFPIWIAGLWLLWVELRVLFYLSKPTFQQPHFLKEVLARWVLMTLLAVCMVAFKIIFQSLFALPNPLTIQSLLQLLFPFILFFSMFFLPLRLIEFWIDWVDCHTISRKVFYIASVIWIMFTIITR
ncbi:MAG: hypothetical protein R2822_18200 [Spirosomataceae bacterium]